MFDKKRVKEIVLATLVADSYSLGAHWIYDEKQLLNLKIDWNELNAPCAIWHKGKTAGDFTHYGDQTIWLYEFLKDKENFDEKEYAKYWLEQIKVYNGYIDSSSKNSINLLEKGEVLGASSSDLSIVGRIASLLLVSKSKKEFLSNVEKFVKLTHNSLESINASIFFAKLLLKVFEGIQIKEAILQLKDESSFDIQEFILKAQETKTADTLKVIREFGPACGVNEGFGGVLHLLFKFDNLKDMLFCNAKAGGDSSTRAMLASMIFSAKYGINSFPKSWLKIKKNI
ncbi:ADP-ribosylglycohydrolase family protein [Malaciobacter mytili]|uniref:ADP-ribosylglycohydrolase family protein n=1 Tax=Malaciobacter mytili TaxID=603050 RepID=UPI003A849FCE